MSDIDGMVRERLSPTWGPTLKLDVLKNHERRWAFVSPLKWAVDELFMALDDTARTIVRRDAVPWYSISTKLNRLEALAENMEPQRGVLVESLASQIPTAEAALAIGQELIGELARCAQQAAPWRPHEELGRGAEEETGASAEARSTAVAYLKLAREEAKETARLLVALTPEKLAVQSCFQLIARIQRPGGAPSHISGRLEFFAPLAELRSSYFQDGTIATARQFVETAHLLLSSSYYRNRLVPMPPSGEEAAALASALAHLETTLMLAEQRASSPSV